MYQATWESVVSSVTWSGGSFSRLRRRRGGTWSLQPAWWSSSPCSLLPPVSPTAMGERGEGRVNEAQGNVKIKERDNEGKKGRKGGKRQDRERGKGESK